MKRLLAYSPKHGPAAAALLLPAALAAALICLMYALFFPGRPAAAQALSQAGDMSRTVRSDRLPAADRMYRALDFTLTDEKGEPVLLSSFAGKVVVITFFSSWSEECREEAVRLSGLGEAAEAAGAVLVIADRLETGRETREQALAFLRQAGVRAPVLFDENVAVYSALDLKWIPNTLFFSPGGVLMSSVPGPGISVERLVAHIAYAREGGLPATEDFVLSNLLTWQGAAADSYRIVDRMPRVTGALSAQAQALLLEYAAGKGDRALFDIAYRAAGTLLSRDGLLVRRREVGLSGEVSETGQDLKALGALMKADAAFGGYGDQIAARAAALMRRAVGPGDTLRDSYDFTKGALSSSLALWQANLPVLKELALLDGAWAPVYEKALHLAQGAAIPGDLPLFRPVWDYRAGAYTGEVIRMSESLTVLVHLAEVGKLPPGAADKVKALLRYGRIDAGYTAKGLPAEGYRYESPAVYGLCVRLGLLLGDVEMARLALEKMDNLRVFLAESPLDGSYSQVLGTDIPASDVLAALCAWQAVADSGLMAGEREMLR